MNRNLLSPPAPTALWLKVVYGATIFLSAFLLFQVQPIISKMILPWYGGSSSVWTTCLLFFQSMLLFGYLYTHFLVRVIPPRVQGFLHIALLLLAAVLLPIAPNATWKPIGEYDPSMHLLGVLGLSVGLPYFVLSTTGPLLQVWFAREKPGTLPYRLFALSNLGSMTGLLSYPFVIEPVSSASVQSSGWSFGFALFAALCGFLAWRGSSTAVPSPSPAAHHIDSAKPGFVTHLTWLLLAACPSLLLVSLTGHLTRDVAPIPMLWVIPLAIYLLSFIISFDHLRWYKRTLFVPLFIAFVAVVCYLATADNDELGLTLVLSAYLLALFVFSMVCHGELVRLAPPADHLTIFFLMIAGGGALGGLVVALVAPQIFSADYEFPIGVVLSSAVVFAVLAFDRELITKPYARFLRASVLLAGLGITAGSGFFLANVELKKLDGALLASRNFYGSLRVDRDGSGEDSKLSLMHGAIVHGSQFLGPDRQAWPSTYYGEPSGIGLTLRYFERQSASVRAGVVGLGAGTLAAYARAGDQYRFYEINPAVLKIAYSYFSYLKNTPAKVDTVLGDARLSLERESPQKFDVLAIDAFSGDSIPIHLLTQEAFREYFRHLAPGGVLAVHASNQYLNLAPVVKLVADELGKIAVVVTSDDDDDKGIERADWILVTENQKFLDSPEIKDAASSIKIPANARAWTDDFSSVIPILQ